MSLSMEPKPDPINAGKILISVKDLKGIPISSSLTIVNNSLPESKCIYEDWSMEILTFGKQLLLEIRMTTKNRPEQLAHIISVVRTGKFRIADSQDLSLPNCFHKPRIQYGVAHSH